VAQKIEGGVWWIDSEPASLVQPRGVYEPLLTMFDAYRSGLFSLMQQMMFFSWALLRTSIQSEARSGIEARRN